MSMTEFRFPPLNEQTAYALKSVVWRARTLADLRLDEIVYVRLFARCSLHGDFSQVFAEDEVVGIETQSDGLVRLHCQAVEHFDENRLCPVVAFATARNPYRT
jgi:hypothetical protein